MEIVFRSWKKRKKKKNPKKEMVFEASCRRERNPN